MTTHRLRLPASPSGLRWRRRVIEIVIFVTIIVIVIRVTVAASIIPITVIVVIIIYKTHNNKQTQFSASPLTVTLYINSNQLFFQREFIGEIRRLECTNLLWTQEHWRSQNTHRLQCDKTNIWSKLHPNYV